MEYNGSKSGFRKGNVRHNKKVVEDKARDDRSMEDLIYGRNAVNEALKSGRSINKILVSIGAHGSVNKIISDARKSKIVIQEVEQKVLNKIANGENHQGIVAMISPFDYCSVDDILNRAKEKNEKAFIVIADGITDPHNLGAIMRTAECTGVHGIIIPKRNAVPVTSTVVKVAAGAAEYMLVARENNLTNTIEYLKENGVWVFGADEDSKKYIYDEKLDGDIAIVIGGEDSGIRKNVMNSCDGVVKIPMKGKVTSLNASVAGAVMMYEVLRQRN